MVNHLGLGCFPFARRYLGNRIFFLFLRVLRCFSSPGSPPYTMYSCMDTWALPQAGFPIRKSLDQRLLAPPQSLSQLTTSFIGSQRQGIHPTLFLTWPFHFLRENVTFYYLKSALADLIRIVYDMQFSMCKAQYYCANGGDKESRTPDPLLARQVLSQLSYAPTSMRDELSRLDSKPISP